MAVVNTFKSIHTFAKNIFLMAITLREREGPESVKLKNI